MKPILKIILASKSPRRKQILEWANIPFEIVAQETEEDVPQDMPVSEIPAYLAMKKGQAVANIVDLDSSLVIAADTIVVWQGNIFGKPSHRQEAVDILKKLSGSMHEVLTGVSLHWQKQQTVFTEQTRVWFSPLTDKEIEYYIDKYAPYDKAGAYAIQEWIGVTTICKVEGCFFNVMGLPMNRLYHTMKTHGLLTET